VLAGRIVNSFAPQVSVPPRRIVFGWKAPAGAPTSPLASISRDQNLRVICQRSPPASAVALRDAKPPSRSVPTPSIA
jgi:hypothetical protein